MSDTLAIDFVLACAQRALDQAVPTIWNNDQGSHFTSPQYTDLLLAAGVQTPALAAQATCWGDTRTHENGAYHIAHGWCEVDAHWCHEPEAQADPTT